MRKLIVYTEIYHYSRPPALSSTERCTKTVCVRPRQYLFLTLFQCCLVDGLSSYIPTEYLRKGEFIPATPRPSLSLRIGSRWSTMRPPRGFATGQSWRFIRISWPSHMVSRLVGSGSALSGVRPVYTRDHGLYERLCMLSNDRHLDVAAVIPLAYQVNRSMADLGPIDISSWTTTERSSIIDHIINVAYSRVIHGQNLISVLKRGSSSRTYGELRAEYANESSHYKPYLTIPAAHSRKSLLLTP